jgi:acetylornithine/succinyldiaminopimelate/putrescine aminotransferase
MRHSLLLCNQPGALTKGNALHGFPRPRSTDFFHIQALVEIDHGDGVYLYTKSGDRYLDIFAGIAVNALGHSHPRIIGAITEQAQKYIHLSNYFVQEPQLKLAELLLQRSGYERVFFSNSGTEATEGASRLQKVRCYLAKQETHWLQ